MLDHAGQVTLNGPIRPLRPEVESADAQRTDHDEIAWSTGTGERPRTTPAEPGRAMDARCHALGGPALLWGLSPIRSRANRADAVVGSSRAIVTMASLGLVAATIGLVTWMATMASAPRYSYGPDEDSGDLRSYFVVVLLAALTMGFVVRTRAWLLGATLGLPGLVLAPWTAL